MFIVYVLKSDTGGRIYIGQTNNIVKRLGQHNDLNFDKKSYTKLSRRNWKLVYKEQYHTRREALNREKQLKSHKGRDWLKTVLAK